MKIHEELFNLAQTLENTASNSLLEATTSQLKALEDAANEIGRSFSGSWMGYHSCVYYKDFAVPPPGAHFSQEWGLKDMSYTSLGTRGEWREYDAEEVKRVIRENAGNPDLAQVNAEAQNATGTFDRIKADLQSILIQANQEGTDNYLTKLVEQLDSFEPLGPRGIAKIWSPRGRVMTRDTIVIGQGTRLPPHIAILAEVASIRQVFDICAHAAKIARQAGSHLERRALQISRDKRVGTNVFIGHGRSSVWRELKDFVQDRLGLPWDEFNRVPVAGVTNIARLSEMLDSAAVALIIMTAEDETAEGELQARMNVIHEAGLFQGRLGFTKAIVLLEDGCSEFSNIQGLGQIRFPRGNISAVFEEVRQVFEREGIISG